MQWLFVVLRNSGVHAVRASSVIGAAFLIGCGGDVVIDGGGGGGASGGTTNDASFVGLLDEPPDPGGTNISAHFDEDAPASSWPGIGTCRGSVIPTSHETPVDAGTIEVFGADKPITLSGASGAYGFDDASEDWGPGAKVGFQVSGSDAVPPFSASAVAPDRVLVLAPPGVPPGAPDQYPVDASAGLEVRWKPFKRGQVYVTLNGQDPKRKNSERLIECLFDPHDGEGTIEPSLLTSLALGRAGLAVYSVSSTTRAVGSWSVDVTLGAPARTPSGQVYAAPLLQLE